MAIDFKFQNLRATASAWTTNDPTLLSGQFGYETDTGKIKIGDGATAWTSLPYLADPLVLDDVADLITLSGLAGNTTDLGTGYNVISDNADFATAFGEIDTALANISSGFSFQGNWDASAGTFPGSGSANTGYTYKISVAGTVDGVEFNIGDTIYAVTNSASTTTYAGNWVKIDSTDQVASVFGRTGTVVAAASDYDDSQVDYTGTPTNFTASDAFVSGAIDGIDTAIGTKQADVITTRGDIIRGSATGVAERLALGATQTVVKSDGTDVSFSDSIDCGVLV